MDYERDGDHVPDNENGKVVTLTRTNDEEDEEANTEEKGADVDGAACERNGRVGTQDRARSSQSRSSSVSPAAGAGDPSDSHPAHQEPSHRSRSL